MTQTDPNAGLTLPPPPPDTGNPSGAIGIPAGYKPPIRQIPAAPTPGGQHLVPGPETIYGTTPNTTNVPSLGLVNGVFQEGAQWAPQNQPPADVYGMQKQLVQAGLLSQSNLRPGVWDTSSASAYKSVLAFANATGMGATDALNFLVSNPQSQANAASSHAPVQMTAPGDVAAAVSGGGPHTSNTARDLLGHDLPASEVNDFQKWYQQQETNARAQYLAAGPGGSYTGAPNVTDAAQVYIKQHNLGEQVAYGTASRMLEFFNLLKGVV